MKRLFIPVFFVLVLFLGCSSIDDDSSVVTGNINKDGSINLEHFELTFCDDFESGTIDETKWRYSPEIKRQNAGYWKNECSSFENGNYVITCKADKNGGLPLSGGIQTNGKFEQAFGLYHIRFMIEKADHLWYAFWLLCDEMENDTKADGSAIDGAELDIFEIVPGANEGKADFGSSVHWDGYGENLKSASNFDFSHSIRDFSTFYGKYHDIWYLWDKDGYKLYLDGTEEKNLVYNLPGDKYGNGVCSVPCYMIISAEYGIWGGELDVTQLPAHFYVDLVEVYKEKQFQENQLMEKETDEIPCNNYRQAMRDFVINISETARETNPAFIVIPQNGQNVAWDDDDAEVLLPDQKFFNAINGTGREDIFYGTNASYDIADGTLTPANLSKEMQELCDLYTAAGLTVLAIDYTNTDKSKINDSFSKNAAKGYIPFAATKRDLSLIPSYEPYNKNDENINKLSDAKNFLYLINPNQKDFPTKEAFISALEQTDYDLFVIDLFCCDQALSADDIQRLKVKKNGARRLVICYMSIGEAEDYRWYWQKQWKSTPPAFLCSENPEWEGNYKVKYWYPDWQTIICGEDSYLSKIIQADFDGVYLDIIDAFEYFEEK